MTQPIRRDPSGSKSVERLFAKNLTALVRRYDAECRAFVVKHAGRSLESPVYKPPIAADDLIKSLQQLAGITISQHAEPIAEAAAILSYQHGKDWADKALSTRGAIDPATGKPKLFFLPQERRAIEKIKARNLMEIQGMTDELAKKMSRSLVEGFEKRETINKLVRRVMEVTDFGKTRVVVIARTETMRAVNGAARDRYEQYGIEKVEFLASLDGRECTECAEKHGQIYDLPDAPDLPVHPQCRCTLAPVVGESGTEEKSLEARELEQVQVVAGADGKDGEDGLSAFELWKARGHIGTESDFFAFLKGKDGKDGKDGAPGKDGADGKDGTDGKPGKPGKDGESIRGPPGKDGKDGKDGKPGKDGKDGLSAYEVWLKAGNKGTEKEFLKSLKGPKGDRGFNGIGGGGGVGAIGPAGPTGATGATGTGGYAVVGTAEPAGVTGQIWLDTS